MAWGSKRSYLTSKAGAAAKRIYPRLRLGQPGGATPVPRPGVVAGRGKPTSREQWLLGHRRA